MVVLDDHSTDGTGDIARRIAATDPRYRRKEVMSGAERVAANRLTEAPA